MLALVAAVLAGGARAQLSFDVQAADFQRRMGIECGDGCSIPEVLRQHYLRVGVGSFDLYYPAPYLSEARERERLVEIAGALVDLESAWRAWLEPATGASRALEKDAKEVRKWIAGWKPEALAGAAEGERELLSMVAGKERQLEAFQRYREACLSGQAYGLDLAGRDPAVLVMAPDRESLVGAASFVGLVDEINRSAFWTDDVIFWTDFWWNDVGWVALEYPPAFPTTAEWQEGIDMNAREETGMLEHVVQRASFGLEWRMFGRGIEPAFEAALAQNAVIEVFGENNTRSGGSTKGKQTRAYSQFIPGGNSAGGILPKNNADSRWRHALGADWFVTSLHQSQETAGKELGRQGDRISHFELWADHGEGRVLVTAPFLGTAALDKELPPPEFLSDYREFFRAYKSCFAHWLRTDGAKGRRSSPERFATLLQRLADEGSGEQLEPLVEELYGVPLSAPTTDQDSLEGRFLAWLRRQ